MDESEEQDSNDIDGMTLESSELVAVESLIAPKMFSKGRDGKTKAVHSIMQ